MKSKGYMSLLGKSFFAASVAALLWVAYGAAAGLVPKLGIGNERAPMDPGAQPVEPRSGPLKYDVEQIVETHLFGRTPEPGAVADAADAPETKLQLALAGVVASSNDMMARAMISVDGGRIKSYRVGQQLEGTDAILYQVKAMNVLLTRSGAIERLPMKRQVLAGLVGHSPASKAATPLSKRGNGENGGPGEGTLPF